MSDVRLRQLEREAHNADTVEAWRRYYREAHRLGQISDWQLETAAFLEHPAVKGLVPDDMQPMCHTLYRYVRLHGGYMTDYLHDVADSWASNLYDFAREREESQPWAENLLLEALVIALEVTADRMHEWGWDTEQYQRYKHLLRNLPDELPVTDKSWGAGFLAYLFNQSAAIGNATDLVGIHYYHTREVVTARRAFDELFRFYYDACLQRSTEYGAELMRFCHELTRRLGDWVLKHGLVQKRYRQNPPSWKRLLKMYSALVSVGGNEDLYKINVKRLIRTFDREDRVTYVIHLHRYREIQRLLRELRDKLTDRERKKLEKVARHTERSMKIGPGWPEHGYQLTMDNLVHYVTTAIQNEYNDVLSYVWEININPSAILEQLSLLEARAIDKARGKELPLKAGRILLNFDDGYYWVMLNVGQCELEGKAMAHCGNIGDDPYQRILSLRKDDAKGKPKAHLTFIWHQVPYPGEASVPWPSAPQATQGYLGETKGYANTKPAKKYHPHIIELLKLPMVQYNVGGGYQPENNFHLSDLTTEQKDKLYHAKPQLFGLQEFMDAYGWETATIFLSHLTAINDAPLKEKTPHLPLVETPQGLLVVLDEYTEKEPLGGLGGRSYAATLFTRLEALGFYKFSEALQELVEWAERSTTCQPVDPHKRYMGAVNKTPDISDEADYDDLPHMPEWENIHFEVYLEELAARQPELFEYFMSYVGREDLESTAEYIRKNWGAYIGEEYFDMLKIFLPSEDAGLRWGYLRKLSTIQTSTGATLELDLDRGTLLLYLAWERFFQICSAKLENPDDYKDWQSTDLFTGNLPIPSLPKEPLISPPSEESIRCFIVILDDIKINVERSRAERAREKLHGEGFRKWLEEDYEEDPGWEDDDEEDLEEPKEEPFRMDEYLDGEDEDDEDIDMWL